MTDTEMALFGPDGEPTALARRADPATSHDAARSIQGDRLRDSQEAILALLRRFGPMCDTELLDTYQRYAASSDYPRQSPSGIRSRRHELVNAGRVVDTGERMKLSPGRQSIIWAAT